MLTLNKLARCLPLGLGCGQGRNDNLGVGSQEEVAKDLEVSVQTLDAPLHREGVNGDHHGLVLGQASQLRCDVLIDAGNDARSAILARKNGLLNDTCVAASQD